MGGARPKTCQYSQSTERRFAGVSSISNSIGSASPFSESGRWGSTGKQPILFPPRNFSGSRSFMSKPVYPLVFRYPDSDSKALGLANTSSGSRFTPIESTSSPMWRPESSLSPGLKFHKALTELQKMEASPEPNTSSRREGFRWSNASSYDFGFEGDSIDISEHIGLENLISPNNSLGDQKCGLCGRLLRQKSPWSSYRIVRNGDMPIAGVLPCSHVFHAECLEETTPKTQINEPSCPSCLKAGGAEGSAILFSEPLQVALRSAHMSQMVTSDAGIGGNLSVDQTGGEFRRNRSLQMLRRLGSSVIKNHFKNHFSFRGRVGKDSFGAKVFGKAGSTSSFPCLHANKKQSKLGAQELASP